MQTREYLDEICKALESAAAALECMPWKGDGRYADILREISLLQTTAQTYAGILAEKASEKGQPEAVTPVVNALHSLGWCLWSVDHEANPEALHGYLEELKNDTWILKSLCEHISLQLTDE